MAPFSLLQIAFTAEDLYDKEKVDIEHVVMEEVMQLLQSVLFSPLEGPRNRAAAVFGGRYRCQSTVRPETPLPSADLLTARFPPSFALLALSLQV